MSYNQQQPKQSPCNRGCGKWVHFNPNNPARLNGGKLAPLEYVQGPQGYYEVQHDCPVWRQQQAQQPQAPPGPTGPLVAAPGAAAPYQGPAAGGQPTGPVATGAPSAASLMLDELKAIRAVLERLEKRTTPAAEIQIQPPAQEAAASDEFENPPETSTEQQPPQ